MAGQRAPSQLDVARLAGASPQTVSRVAKGESNVSEALRARVMHAMIELGYRPNAAARAVRLGAFRAVGVVYNTLGPVGIHRSLEEISERAAERGHATTLIPLAASSTRDANGAFTRLSEMSVDVLIALIADQLQADGSLRLPKGVPAVVIGPPVLPGASSVDFDQAGGAELAVTHLLELGHRTVHHIRGPENSFSASARMLSWASTLSRHGRRVPPPERGNWSAASGYMAARRLLEVQKPTAIFAANDQMALGAYRAIQEAGMRIPEDVSVVGFDGIDEVAMLVPPLTTIAQPWDRLGSEALRVALSMGSGAGPETVIIPTRLVVRHSTSTPKGVS
ncbi:LacI family DNA-binding transcriptional regulator [Agromyces silvae]|uniref:LacI family DNA-binding transcriptional regulator n=1 Tax=Agromyces silvae TaxID=3388266 RepID=UPI00280B1AA7|nr:substrate-binding domain-containing protein [Agromyces protaetiae]